MIPRLLLAALTAILLVPLESPHARAAEARSKFAAIAYSEDTGRWGYSYGKGSRADAEDDALDRCGDGAEVVAWVEHGWVALAVGDNGSWGAAWSTKSRADAENRALRSCGRGGRIACWAYSD